MGHQLYAKVPPLWQIQRKRHCCGPSRRAAGSWSRKGKVPTLGLWLAWLRREITALDTGRLGHGQSGDTGGRPE